MNKALIQSPVVEENKTCHKNQQCQLELQLLGSQMPWQYKFLEMMGASDAPGNYKEC